MIVTQNNQTKRARCFLFVNTSWFYFMIGIRCAYNMKIIWSWTLCWTRNIYCKLSVRETRRSNQE